MKKIFLNFGILTREKFFALTLISQISFLYILFFGSVTQLISAVIISIILIICCSSIVYHRYISHKSWNCPRWYEIFASILGIFAFTGSTITRTAIHRQHHAFVDVNRDPHSPHIIGQFKVYYPFFNKMNVSSTYARDLLTDPLHKIIHQYYVYFIIIFFICGLILTDLQWAVALILSPGALCWINVCILNTIGHKEKGGTNSFLLSLFTLGEGNHKYHHENPTDPNTGGLFDPGYLIIKILNKKII